MRSTFEEIHADLNRVLTGSASVPRSKGEDVFPLDRMLAAALPALCRRTCELACSIGSVDNVSADILCCHQNNVEDSTLYVNVYESYPNYGLDRTILERNGFWTLHTREIAYGNPNHPASKVDVIAEALLSGKSLMRSVFPESLVPSEKRMVAVRAIIPDALKSLPYLKKVRPAEIVSLSMVFYDNTPVAYMSLLETIERLHYVEDHLNALHKLSLFQSLPHEERWAGLRKLVNSINAGAIVRLTLPEIVEGAIRSLK
jgi:hypothetical protein